MYFAALGIYSTYVVYLEYLKSLQIVTSSSWKVPLIRSESQVTLGYTASQRTFRAQPRSFAQDDTSMYFSSALEFTYLTADVTCR